MDKYELLGFLLHNLRNDHGPDEEDIDAPRLRETTRIFELMVRHGHLTRDMFDPRGVASAGETSGIPEKYNQWQQTSYPIIVVVLADQFADWIIGVDDRDRLELMDLIARPELLNATASLQASSSATSSCGRVSGRQCNGPRRRPDTP